MSVESNNNTLTTASTTPDSNDGSSFLSMATAQKAGVGLAIIVGVILILLVILWLMNKRKKQLKRRAKHGPSDLVLVPTQSNFSISSNLEKGPSYHEVPLQSPRRVWSFTEEARQLRAQIRSCKCVISTKKPGWITFGRLCGLNYSTPRFKTDAILWNLVSTRLSRVYQPHNWGRVKPTHTNSGCLENLSRTRNGISNVVSTLPHRQICDSLS